MTRIVQLIFARLLKECTFDASKGRFPYLFQGRTINVEKILAILDGDLFAGKAPALVLEPGASTSLDVGVTPTLVNGLLIADFDVTPALGKWTLSASLTPDQAKALNDILVVFRYTIS